MISFCVPSRGRPKYARRLVDTVLATQHGKTEFLFYLNSDDPKLEEYKDLLKEKWYTVGPNQSTCFSWNLMSERAKNDVVMLMGDDVQINTPKWDKTIVRKIDEYKDKILMVVPSDGKVKNYEKYGRNDRLWDDSPLPAAHFAVHKNWLKALGFLAPPYFWHWYVDSWTQKLARKVNRCLYLPSVEFRSKKIMEDDAGRQVRQHLNIKERDTFVYKKIKRNTFNSDLKLLRNFIESF